jgi:hypothetical protein
MKTNILTIATGLSDQNLLAQLHVLAGREREACAELLAPRPDVPTSVRRLPASIPAPFSSAIPAQAASAVPSEPNTVPAPPPAVVSPAPRPIVQATAPERYRVQFTIGQDTHEKLRRLQALLRREIPDGDPAAIFGRALTLLLETVEKRRLGAAKKPLPRVPIRPGTDGSRCDAGDITNTRPN